MVLHVVVKLLNRVLVRSSAYIEQKSVVGLEILANTLKEPFVRVNLAVVALLDAEHKIYSASLKQCIFDAKVPCCALEDMQNICWNFFGRDTFIHYVTHVLHLEVAITV